MSELIERFDTREWNPLNGNLISLALACEQDASCLQDSAGNSDGCPANRLICLIR